MFCENMRIWSKHVMAIINRKWKRKKRNTCICSYVENFNRVIRIKHNEFRLLVISSILLRSSYTFFSNIYHQYYVGIRHVWRDKMHQISMQWFGSFLSYLLLLYLANFARLLLSTIVFTFVQLKCILLSNCFLNEAIS